MTKQREPMKFNLAEWRANLNNCTPAARSVWLEMLCIMHDAEPHGHLLVHGRPPAPEELAEAVSVPVWQMPYLLDTLEAAGVFCRTAEGVIYSPRMVREEKRRQVARRNGKAGGNPSLSKAKDNSSSDNPAGRNTKARRREAE